jgi:5-methylcytosine-specific restriction endonuclease McrA
MSKKRRGRITGKYWSQKLRDYGHRCAYCARKGNRKTLTRDHLVPLVQGGYPGGGNVVPACLACNRSKRDSSLLLWIWALRENTLHEGASL